MSDARSIHVRRRRRWATYAVMLLLADAAVWMFTSSHAWIGLGAFAGLCVAEVGYQSGWLRRDDEAAGS